MRAFSRFAWGVLAYNLLVIAWGAYVRATGSGAGCGAHWPTCQGAIVPPSPTVATLVEYSHRISSGLSLLLVGALVFAAWFTFEKGHAARRAAVAAAGFMVAEALLGAVLVLFRLVAHDASVARAIVMPIHLLNTFFLLAALALTAWFGSGGRPFRLRGQGATGLLLAGGVAGMLLLGVSGAVTALGDTLFPVASFIEGWRQDFAPAAHLFVRLRILHPTIAVAVGVYLAVAGVACALLRQDRKVRILAGTLVGIFAVQIAVGVVNLILLAPVPVQMLHLFLADLTWIALVLLAASALAAPARTRAARAVGRLPPRPAEIGASRRRAAGP